MALPASWLNPDWPAPANVRATCTTREGGVSGGTYESLNLGDHVADAPDAVAANRKLFADAIGARPVFLRQVHGQHVAALDVETPDGIDADACVTDARGVACTIMVADCLPVLFTTKDGRAVAAAHAGWRGFAGESGVDSLGGVLEAACEALMTRAQAPAADLLAWLGPCIGPDAFEVGPEVKAAFEMQDAEAASLFRPYAPGKWLADLPGLARRRLRALGIGSIHGNDGSAAWCTVHNPSRFFSHRRDRVSGRLAAAVWRA